MPEDYVDISLVLARRVLLIWQILICIGDHRISVSESQLASMSSLQLTDLKEPLEIIRLYCEDHNLPPLTSLVHEDFKGLRIIVGEEHEIMKSAREYNWFSLTPPESFDFEQYL